MSDDEFAEYGLDINPEFDDDDNYSDFGEPSGIDDETLRDDVIFSQIPTQADWARMNIGGQGDVVQDRAKRDTYTYFLEQTRASLNENMYQNFSEDVKNDTRRIIDKIPEKEVILFNVDVFASAVLFTLIYKPKGGLTPKNVKKYLQQTNNLGNARIKTPDFIRYCRKIDTYE